MATKSERIARERFIYYLWLEDRDRLIESRYFRNNIPDEWHTITEDFDVEEPKVKMTIYVDQSVAKSFKSMGKGFHKRINRILQTWLQLKMSDAIERDRRMKGIVDAL